MVLIKTVNKQCSSGLQVIVDVASCIKVGYYSIVVGIILESLKSDKIVLVVFDVDQVKPNEDSLAQTKHYLLLTGISFENVVKHKM